MGDEEGPAWLGTAAAADYLGIRPRTLYRLINEGRLPAYPSCSGLPGADGRPRCLP